MADLNQVILLGRVAKAPELKDLKDGHKVCRLVIAVKPKFDSEKTDFFEVTVWNTAAENCAKYLSVGASVLAEGYLQKVEWTGKDGKKQYKTAIVANTIQFMPGTKKGEE